MIPITCPTCGRRGTIPNERVNTRMHCKKCDAVFHMEKSGKILLGEPGAAKSGKGGPPGKTGGAPGKGKPAKAKRKDEPAFTNVGELLAIIPNWAKIAGAVLLVGAALMMSGIFNQAPTDPSLNYTKYGDDLDPRIMFVGNMFADNNVGAIRNVATDESKGDVEKWMAKVRPLFKFEGPEKPGQRCEIQKFQPEGNEASGAAEVAIHIVPPMPYSGPEVEAEKKSKTLKLRMKSGYDRDGMFDLGTYWIKKGKQWQLDATKSLQNADGPAGEATKGS